MADSSLTECQRNLYSCAGDMAWIICEVCAHLKSEIYHPDFYPRPVLAFGYCHRLGVCVCVSPFFVRAITHPTFQLESSNLDQQIQQILLKCPIVFGVDWPWPSRSNLTSFQNSVYLHRFCVLKYLCDLHKNGSFLNCCPAQMIPHICVPYRFQYTRWHGRATDRETV